MQTCLICLEDDQNLITPKHCSCKVYLHQKCLFMIESYNLLCPICRIKNNKSNYIMPHIFNNHGSIIDRILHSPLALFIKYPNFITFTINIIFSCFIIFCFILPIFLFVWIKSKLYRNLFQSIEEARVQII